MATPGKRLDLKTVQSVLPELSNETYHSWRAKLTATRKAEQLWKYVDGSHDAAVAAATTARTANEVQRANEEIAVVKGYLLLLVPDDIQRFTKLLSANNLNNAPSVKLFKSGSNIAALWPSHSQQQSLLCIALQVSGKHVCKIH
eukprot:TRINITY_DN10185_c0_g1_i2.p1 TRINITY_DN10185_c0_g1~~TRINITY_DN10185_c0_g1_i2.p1  ORF type:complete len:144 (-),score=32.27 TRINITY_DN10185_c0_g1_i2:770-1201(-)